MFADFACLVSDDKIADFCIKKLAVNVYKAKFIYLILYKETKMIQ